MDKLIRDLGAAAEGSRELDAEVMRAMGFVLQDFGGKHWARGAYPYGKARPPNFSPTTSFDAALSLMPEGWWYEKSLDNILTIGPTPHDIQNSFSGQSATPILALCIAVLKARSIT